MSTSFHIKIERQVCVCAFVCVTDSEVIPIKSRRDVLNTRGNSISTLVQW